MSGPFQTLVFHFVRRLFASEEEQGGELGFSIGAVLAMLAAPGAFASLVLLGKYSSLIAWLRGIPLHAIERSPADEYFFILLSMTVTGLVMVARWNRLFPDRRDFANLAVLPFPVRDIFQANFAALTGLSLVFAIVVNAVSAVFFPLIVTLSIGTTSAFVRVAGAHAVAVFCASLFSFFAVFALVGVLMLVLPARIFRSVSVAVRIVLVVGLLCEFFGNVLVEITAVHSTTTTAQWLPSFWFLGVYEWIAGIAKPHMAMLGERALLSLAVALFVSIGAYALSYQRIFARLPETFEMMGASRSFFHVRLPETMLRPCFRTQYERACICFTSKVLARSETHLLFIGAYLGVGLVIAAESGSRFAIPLLTAFFVASGLRFVFDIPAARESNWIFRMTSDRSKPSPRQIARRMILFGALWWQFLILLPIAAHMNGFRVALFETAYLALLTILFTEALLLSFQKIPFTCLTQRDVRQRVNSMIMIGLGLLILVPMLVGIEKTLLAKPLRFLIVLAVLCGGCFAIHRHGASNEQEVMFEEGTGPVFDVVHLS